MSTYPLRRTKKRKPQVAAPRLHPFERAVLETARRRRLLPPGARVLVALSGGADSTALAAALAALRDVGRLGEVLAVHVDHRLRPGSEADGEACARLCRRLGIAFEAVAVEVRPAGDGVQAAARRARYAALAAAAERLGADRIATGHHRADQAETVLHRLLRGTGARGLGGIPPRRGRIVRPLLDRSREEVRAYLRDRGLDHREDPSNATRRYLRNRLRHEALPALGALAPGLEARLARAADLLREDDRALERLAARVAPAGARAVALPALLAAPAAVRRRVLRRLWRAAAGTRSGLEAHHVEAALRLLRAPGPRRLAWPRGLELRAGGGEVRVAPPEASPTPPGPALRVDGPGRYAIPGRPGIALEIAWVSGAPPPWPLELRTRCPGDRFRPAGGKGGKKLKAWLIDRKVPRARRGSLLVLADESGQVLSLPELGVWAAGAEGLEIRFSSDVPKGGPRT